MSKKGHWHFFCTQHNHWHRAVPEYKWPSCNIDTQCKCINDYRKAQEIEV